MFTLIARNQYGQQLELTHNDAYSIKSIDGLDPPEAVINTTHNAGLDGSVYNSAYMSDRVITITLAIEGPAEENRINLYKYFKSKFAGIGLVVKLDYDLTKSEEAQIKNYYHSMGTKWKAQNTHERIPNVSQ